MGDGVPTAKERIKILISSIQFIYLRRRSSEKDKQHIFQWISHNIRIARIQNWVTSKKSKKFGRFCLRRAVSFEFLVFLLENSNIHGKMGRWRTEIPFQKGKQKTARKPNNPMIPKTNPERFIEIDQKKMENNNFRYSGKLNQRSFL